MLFKLLTLAVIGFVIYYFFIRKFLNKKNKDDKSIEMMVECDTCGTFVSSNEAIFSSGKYFCSNSCLERKA